MNRSSSFGINTSVLAIVPKGLEDLARGFNPGFGIQKSSALKAAPGRDVVSPARVPNPAAQPSGATFRAHPIHLNNPGLKPWAESSSPFGTKNSEVKLYGTIRI